jgi:hypothetical protein
MLKRHNRRRSIRPQRPSWRIESAHNIFEILAAGIGGGPLRRCKVRVTHSDQ